MNHYILTTLGCKVNQCESSALASMLEAAGYRPVRSPGSANLIVINTCTVTGKAAMQSRQAIRKMVRQHPDAKIVVTGCYAQVAPDEIQTIDGIDIIVGHADKLTIPDLIGQIAATDPLPTLVHRKIHPSCGFEAMPSVVPKSRTRAYLKVQDGCNAYCTYCIVPHARGRSRSMPIDDVLNHLANLSLNNFKEVVLTGIHLGAYGLDLAPKSSLSELLRHIIQRNILQRLRLSSIEPTEIDKDLIGLIADPLSPLCPHLHVPLQSGDNAILKRMGRPYTREQFSQAIGEIRAALPFSAIGLDVLVGFPGEDDDAFSRTYTLIKSLEITYLHVFPFSPRKGTPAADMKPKVPERIVNERCRRLRELGEKKKRNFLRANLGRTVDVLVETTGDDTGQAKGLSENYLSVILPETNVKKNSIVKVQISSLKDDLTLIGDVVNTD